MSPRVQIRAGRGQTRCVGVPLYYLARRDVKDLGWLQVAFRTDLASTTWRTYGPTPRTVLWPPVKGRRDLIVISVLGARACATIVGTSDPGWPDLGDCI